MEGDYIRVRKLGYEIYWGYFGVWLFKVGCEIRNFVVVVIGIFIERISFKRCFKVFRISEMFLRLVFWFFERFSELLNIFLLNFFFVKLVRVGFSCL